MVISLIPLTVSAMFSAKLQARESTKIGYSAIVKIGSLLGLIIILAEPYGLLGLSISVLVSFIFNTIFLCILYYKKDNKNGKS